LKPADRGPAHAIRPSDFCLGFTICQAEKRLLPLKMV
jgi:hypothetical protein